MRIALAAAAAAMMMAPVFAEARTWRVAPGPEAQTELQHALSEVEPGDTVRLDRGRYELTQGLTLAVRGVEVRGEGQDRTVLSFAGQQENVAGLIVSGPGVVLRDFAVEDTRGDAILARDCEGISIRAVRAEWTRGPRSAAYGLHTVNCSNVLIEESIVRGASMAGIGVNGARTVIVRRNIAERNMIGLSIEDGIGVDVAENTAQHNGIGVAVMNSPNPRLPDGHSVRVFANTISDNEAASAGRSELALPTGVGVFVMSARNVHVFDNDIGGNGTANVLIMAAWARPLTEDESYNPLPRDVMIRANRFGRSGAAPASDYAEVLQANGAADVIWDGVDTYYAARGPRTELPHIVMRDNRSARGGVGSFLSLGLNVAGAPLSEAAPDPAYPPLLEIEEPERVRIEN